MPRLRCIHLSTKRAWATSALLFWSFGIGPAFAMKPESAEAPVPLLCGTILRSTGQVQILDPSRTRVLDTGPGEGIPCGGWVSVGPGIGWVSIKHRDGFELYASSGAFLQLNEARPDPVLLYKGELYAQVDDEYELRIITANGRAKMKHGTFVMIYNQAEEDTQLVSLGNPAWLENRFEPTARVKVSGGEATSLNFKLMRIMPSMPKAVGVTALKQKLASFPLETPVEGQALKAAHERQERMIASQILDENPSSETLQQINLGRSPAGKIETPKGDYKRHKTHPNDAQARKKWINRLVAGHPAGEKLLFPKKGLGHHGIGAGNGPVQIEELGSEVTTRKSQQDDKEKRRLIEELSRIRSE